MNGSETESTSLVIASPFQVQIPEREQKHKQKLLPRAQQKRRTVNRRRHATLALEQKRRRRERTY